MTTDASTSDSAWPCAVCGDPAAPEARADCYRCGQYFHLRLTTTATGPDCGDVWIDDGVMALQFACRQCLAEQRGESTPETQQAAPEPSKPRAQRAAGGASARDIARRRR